MVAVTRGTSGFDMVAPDQDRSFNPTMSCLTVDTSYSHLFSAALAASALEEAVEGAGVDVVEDGCVTSIAVGVLAVPGWETGVEDDVSSLSGRDAAFDACCWSTGGSF